MTLTLDLVNADATTALGRRLAERLFPGAVLALVGHLGAGKTHLVRAIAEGLGTPPRAVSSPTFVLIQEYPGRLPIYHFDAYRLHGSAEFHELGAHEYFESGGVCLIEWADKVADCLPSDHLTITLTVLGETSRRVSITAHGEAHRQIVESLTRPTPQDTA
jgi:tRNA threonylcarbamoyladenosine biosynthesis protein TsaE